MLAGSRDIFRRIVVRAVTWTLETKVFRIAAKKVDTGENTFKARCSDGLRGDRTHLENTRVRVFVVESLCATRIDSGVDITVIKTSKVPTAILRQRNSNMKLTGAFGQGVTADVMYAPLGLLCPLGNSTQRVPLLGVVTPELATSTDLLLAPDHHECLRLAEYGSEDDLEGGECALGEHVTVRVVRILKEKGEEVLQEPVLLFVTGFRSEVSVWYMYWLSSELL
ncbi:hypothetical protein HPB51_001078 [Rhipicephalus microplus]|uniref:Peptidase A2 domain-containing protein n=1 Tax=Rhipicephalus microplus TaxID=6941 RepID=A0A9J6EEA5_RHIMP|nr:hypothetical protein HPB51_001078 [Rhipicephalus microplus]